MRPTKTALGSITLLVACGFAACSSSDDKRLGAHVPGASGAPTSGGQGPRAGSDGVGIISGEAGMLGEIGLDAGAGGNFDVGSGGASGGSAGTDAIGGAGGASGGANLGLIVGPETDDEAPLAMGAAHAGFVAAQCGMGFDGAGNLYVCGTPIGTGYLMTCAKYDSALIQKWKFQPTAAMLGNANNSSRAMAVAEDGSEFFGGESYGVPSEPVIGGSDAMVGKLAPDGTLAWVHRWGSAGQESVTAVAVLPDGSVAFTGTSSGQAPGNPAAVAGGPWLARYSAQGTQLWLKQYTAATVGSAPAKLLAFPSGDIAIVGSLGLAKVDGDGNVLSSFLVSAVGIAGAHRLTSLLDITLRPEDKSIYSWGSYSPGYAGGKADAANVALGKYDFDMNLSWYRPAEPTRTAVIDSVENQIWNGDFGTYYLFDSGAVRIATTPDSLYLVGHYSNTYMNGSVPKQASAPVVVGRYDLKGNRIWFREYLIGNGNPFGIAAAAADPVTGDLALATWVPEPLTATYYLVKLSAADGSML